MLVSSTVNELGKKHWSINLPFHLLAAVEVWNPGVETGTQASLAAIVFVVVVAAVVSAVPN